MTPASRAVSRVSDLMEAQRAALLTGDLKALAQLVPELETALRRLAAAATPAEHLERLRHAAARNADLISAAHRGMAQARRVIEGPVAQPLTTYGPKGRQSTVAHEPGHLLSRR